MLVLFFALHVCDEVSLFQLTAARHHTVNSTIMRKTRSKYARLDLFP